MNTEPNRAEAAHSEVVIEKTGFFLFTGWIVTTLIWWCFAFAPMVSETPEWLQRAQTICFGSLPGGLPSSDGWLLLIGGPLLLFFALLTGFSDELKKAIQFILQSRSAKILYIFLIIFTLWQSITISNKIKTGLAVNATSFENIDLSIFPENYPQVSTPLPKFNHISHLGKKISSEDALGKIGIITFVFSHCATVCPTLTKTIIDVMSKLPSEKTYAWFITLDPWRDTPRMIAKQADIWHLPANAFLLSNKPAAIQKTLDQLNVPRSRNEKTGEVTHPGLVYLVNQNGEITYMFNNPPKDWLLTAARKLLNKTSITETKKNAKKRQYSDNTK